MIIVVTEAHDELVEHDVVHHLDAADGAKLAGELLRVDAATLDEIGDTALAKLAQRGPQGKATRSPR